MLLTQVKFAFPFRLELPDLAFFATLDGHPYSVRAAGSDGTRTYLYTGEEVPTEASSGEGEYIWYKAVFNNQGPSRPAREICFAPTSQNFLAKVIDFIGYTFLDVNFEVPGPNPDGDEARTNAIINQALRFGQHFIGIYRAITGESDVFRPTLSDSPGVEVYIAETYSFDEYGVDAQFQRIIRHISWLPPAVTGRTKESLRPEQMDDLERKLRTGHVLPAYMELLLDAKEYSILQSSHRMALVVTEAAFEAFLQDRLMIECEIRGIYQLPMGRGRNTTLAPYSDAVMAGGIRVDLIDRYCKDLCGRSVKTGVAYQEWFACAYNPRNDVVHRAHREISESDAEAAFNATVNFMNFLNIELVRSREEQH